MRFPLHTCDVLYILLHTCDMLYSLTCRSSAGIIKANTARTTSKHPSFPSLVLFPLPSLCWHHFAHSLSNIITLLRLLYDSCPSFLSPIFPSPSFLNSVLSLSPRLCFFSVSFFFPTSTGAAQGHKSNKKEGHKSVLLRRERFRDVIKEFWEIFKVG